MGYYERTAAALALSTSVDAVPILKEALEANASNAGFARTLFGALERNRELRESPQYAAMVKSIVLAEDTFTQAVRGAALASLDDVKYEAARQALADIVEKSTDAEIKASAQQVLEANFPAPKAAPAETAKGKKKK
jgi:hypothetical protein